MSQQKLKEQFTIVKNSDEIPVSAVHALEANKSKNVVDGYEIFLGESL